MRRNRLFDLCVFALVVVLNGCSSGGGGASVKNVPDEGVLRDSGFELPEMAKEVEEFFEIQGDVSLDEGVMDLEDAFEAEDVVGVDDGAIEVYSDETSGDLIPDIPYDGPIPPDALPFEFTREDRGEPLSKEEVEEATRSILKFFKETDFFKYLLRTSHGVDASTGKPDFLNFWNDVVAVKEGDRVTFVQSGVDHNMWIPSSKLLSSAMGFYLLTGDFYAGKVAEQYCKGLVATMKGMVYDQNDKNPYLMARNVMTFDHEFVMDYARWRDDERKKAVRYSSQFYPYVEWNAQRFKYPNNPYWGEVWVTNMRSKDDVCHIVRMTTFLPYVVENAKDEFVRNACSEALEYMKGFNKDIVDSGYYIRTKDPYGNAYIIPDQDLGSYVWYVALDERNECPARLASDMIAYGERKTNFCGTGTGSIYDQIAVITHYYNYAIIWNFHMAALGNALVHAQLGDAYPLLEGLAIRADAYVHPSLDEPGAKDKNWEADVAEFLLQSASLGLPLTSEEARLIQKVWIKTVEAFGAFERWDLWSEDVPDGNYPANGGFRPQRPDGGVDIESVALIFEYCASPFRNPTGAKFVDCDIVKNPSRW